MKKLLLICLSLLSCSAVYAQSNQPDARYCLVCHGSNAQSSPVIGGPNLVILPDWYIKAQLIAFQKEWRGHTVTDLYGQEMMNIAKQMAPEEIDSAIAFIRTLPAINAPTSLNGDATRGQTLYQVCTACHGSKGEGNQTLNAPPLAGQADWYLVKQLQNYKKGERGSHSQDINGLIMRQSMALLTSDTDIQDVVSYINTLPFQSQ